MTAASNASFIKLKKNVVLVKFAFSLHFRISMSSNSLNLTNLPTDVIRMVVGNVGLLEVDNLRLVSILFPI